MEAYNDWMIDEWCGSAPGRYIPLVIIPMWDPPAAAREIERCAARGARAFAFSENPEPLGLPTIHDPGRYWDPVFAAAQDTGLIVCMHVGSSSTMPSICSDAPALASLTWGAVRTAGTLLSWLFSDYFERMSSLKIALSEGNIGWIPYFLERGEQVVDRQRYWAAKSAFKPYDDGKTAGLGASLDTLDVRRTFREHVSPAPASVNLFDDVIHEAIGREAPLMSVLGAFSSAWEMLFRNCPYFEIVSSLIL